MDDEIHIVLLLSSHHQSAASAVKVFLIVLGWVDGSLPYSMVIFPNLLELNGMNRPHLGKSMVS